MKKLLILLLCSILILSGCANKQESTPTIPQNAPESAPEIQIEPATEEITEPIVTEETNTHLLSVAVPASTERYIAEDGTELFAYTAQHMELLLPNEEVADKVILDFLNRVDEGRLDAEGIMHAAQADYDPTANWYPYFYQTLYSPTRIDHSVLSLFGTLNSYSGGTHGSLSCDSANYDLSTGDILTLGSIMHMDADKNQFIELIIDKLSNDNALQLFDGFEEGVYNRLGGDENLYEDFYFTTTGLTFFFAPYEIAPYSAGIITVEIPYEELPGLIYDGYFPAERELVQGYIHSGSFMDTDMEQFNNIAEVKVTTGEEIIVIYPEGTVENVSIVMPGDEKNIPEYTVFAALEMSSNNAVVLSVANESIENISVHYSSDGNQQSIELTK